MWFYTGYFMDDQAQNFFMTQTCGWSLEPHDESSVPMVANPRYSCRSVPKQVCWWHHQIGHLPCCPCSLSGWQLAERGRPVALLSGCVRYSRLPTGMSALLPPTGGGARPLTITWVFWFLASRCGRSLTASPLQPQSFLGATVFCFLRSACTKLWSHRHDMAGKVNCGFNIDITFTQNTNLSPQNIHLSPQSTYLCMK